MPHGCVRKRSAKAVTSGIRARLLGELPFVSSNIIRERLKALTTLKVYHQHFWLGKTNS